MNWRFMRGITEHMIWSWYDKCLSLRYDCITSMVLLSVGFFIDHNILKLLFTQEDLNLRYQKWMHYNKNDYYRQLQLFVYVPKAFSYICSNDT